MHLLRLNATAGKLKWTNNNCESINHVLKHRALVLSFQPMHAAPRRTAHWQSRQCQALAKKPHQHKRKRAEKKQTLWLPKIALVWTHLRVMMMMMTLSDWLSSFRFTTVDITAPSLVTLHCFLSVYTVRYAVMAYAFFVYICTTVYICLYFVFFIF